MSLLKLDKSGILKNIKENEFKLEKDLQNFCENNIESLLDLVLVKSEFVIENYRFDSLCYDIKSKAFVIIEFKKGTNYSVIDQGYAYLATMLNNKAEIILEYNERFDKSLKRDSVDWSQSKIVFISQSFSKFQKDTINFKDLPIELYEIKRFEDDIISFTEIKGERISSSIKTIHLNNDFAKIVDKEVITYSLNDHLSKGSEKTIELFEILKDKVSDMIRDIDVEATKLYVSFKKDRKNIVDIVIQKSQLKLFLNAKIGNISDPKNILRDVSNVGHWGNGDYEIIMENDDDIEYLLSLIKQVYKSKEN